MAALDAAAIAAVDSTRQTAAILDLPEHLRDASGRVRAAELAPIDAPAGLVVAGMGGSAVGGRLAQGVLAERLTRAFAIADGYRLPAWVGPEHLVLASSYSGSTEETLSGYADATERGARRLVASTGGELTERAGRDGVPVIELPGGFQPRAAVGYGLVAALEAAAVAGAAPAIHGEIEAAAALLEDLAAQWGPDGDEDGEAKRVARALHGSIPVIAGAELTAPVAYRWKCQINENASLPCFHAALPELDHNEIVGWPAAGEHGRFSAVFLEDPAGHPRNLLRSQLTAATAGEGAAVVERVRARGETPLERALSLVLLGDLVSVYLAVLGGVDPVDISPITQLKTALAGR